MDSKQIDQLLASRVFHCVHCKNLLQIPVMLVQKAGNMCFSCYENFRGNTDIVALENESLGTILQRIYLPCTYKTEGCNKKLKYEDFQSHQEQCIYQTLTCIFSQTCTRSGFLEELVSHCKEDHADRILTSTNDCYKFGIQQVKEGNFILNTSQGLFILSMKKLENDLKFLIYDFTKAPQDGELNFEITFATDSGNKCIRRCKVVKNLKLFNTSDDSFTTTVHLDSVESAILCSGKTFDMCVQLVNDGNGILNYNFLAPQKCIHCKSYTKLALYGLDYLCCYGHRSCDSCKTKSYSQCIQCNGNIIQNSNLISGNLTSLFRLPCKYKDKGCMIQARNISLHELNCDFKSWTCSEDGCTSNFPHTDLLSHLKNVHGIPSGFGSLPELKINNNACEKKIYHVIEDNLLFEFVFGNNLTNEVRHVHGRFTTVTVNHFIWSINIIRGYDSQPYAFEIKICFPEGNPLEETTLRGFCKNKSSPNFTEKPVKLSDNVLREMCNNNSNWFPYKVRVFKKSNP